MKSENGETEKLQVVNGKNFKSRMALESTFYSSKLQFSQHQLFSIKNGMFGLNSPNFKIFDLGVFQEKITEITLIMILPKIIDFSQKCLRLKIRKFSLVMFAKKSCQNRQKSTDFFNIFGFFQKDKFGLKILKNIFLKHQ